MTQARRNTLALQVRGWAWGCQLHPIKKFSVEKLIKLKK